MERTDQRWSTVYEKPNLVSEKIIEKPLEMFGLTRYVAHMDVGYHLVGRMKISNRLNSSR
ncbi:MAG: hypothetical protein IPO37_07205 [Saprospiraceae bacterium]|nr:hypothetical protein [Saprospiraceae bacterium]